jgi:hypothetical protein
VIAPELMAFSLIFLVITPGSPSWCFPHFGGSEGRGGGGG